MKEEVKEEVKEEDKNSKMLSDIQSKLKTREQALANLQNELMKTNNHKQVLETEILKLSGSISTLKEVQDGFKSV